jgi:O-antigen/teichoic acid export membrane protein
VSGARPVRDGAALLGVAQIMVAAGGLVTTVAVARILGADGVGAYTIAVSIIQIGGIIGTLGVESGIAWSVAGGRWAPGPALRETQLLAILLGAITVAVVLAFRLAFPTAFGSLSVALIATTAACLPFLISVQYSRALAVALDRYEAFVAPIAAIAVLVLVACSLGAWLVGIEGVIVGLLVTYVLTAAGALADAIRVARRHPGHEHAPHELRRVFAFGWRANAPNALQILIFRADVFVLSAVVSNATLGHYSVAVSVTSVLFLAPQTLAQVVFPRVAALSAGADPEHAARETVETKSIRHVSLLTIISVPAVGLASVIFLPLLFGSAFRDSLWLTIILLPGCALFGIATVLAATINGRGRPELCLQATALATPFAFALYAGLIPTFGATGAAVASSLAYLANFAFTARAYRQVTGTGIAGVLVPSRDELSDLIALVRWRPDRGSHG